MKIDFDTTKKCCRCGGAGYRGNRNSVYCLRHSRFIVMRENCVARGVVVPPIKTLEKMVKRNMRCADCNRVMTWTRGEDACRVLTLQHYRDGTLGFVCASCNVRHAAMPGDTYRAMPKDHKRCFRCEEIKPFAMFSNSKWAKNEAKITADCRSCRVEVNRQYRKRLAA